MNSKSNKNKTRKRNGDEDEINDTEKLSIDKNKNSEGEEESEEPSDKQGMQSSVSEEEELDDFDEDEEEDDTQKLVQEAKNYTEKLRNRAVIYIARVPPRMTPNKVKTLLSSFGEVTRVYLVEENPNARKRRRKAGGSSRKKYIEGWIEFQDRKVAKQVARELNSTPITNQKHDQNYGDMWNLKYLRKFQWAHLTEKVAYERRVREQKIRLEMMQAKKENSAYKTLVERGEKMDRIEERRAKKGKETTNNSKKRSFHQVRPIRDENDGLAMPVLASLVQK